VDPKMNAVAPAPEQDEQPNVSPEEQKIYDTVMSMALNMMYGKGAVETLIKKLQGSKDNIAGAIGHTAAMIMSSVSSGAAGKGKSIPDDILFAAGQEVVADLVEIAVKTKLIKEEASDSVAEAALFEGVRIWGKQMQDSGKMTPEIQQIAQKDLQDAGVKWQAPAPRSEQASADSSAGQSPAPPGVVNQAMGAQ